MKIQDYQKVLSTGSTVTTTRKQSAPSESFVDVLDNAAERFYSKISDTTASSEKMDSASALAKKIADIQAAIEEANAKSGYVASQIAPPSSEKIPDTANSSNASKIPTTGTVADVYNEGHLRCSDELNAYFLEAAEKYDIDVKFLKSVAFVESGFRADATSKCGAMGIMQLMPSAAKQYGAEEPYDARQNIMAGAKILSTFLDRYDGDKELTLAAYNAGPGNVKKAGGVPEYTRGYINKVLKYYNS